MIKEIVNFINAFIKNNSLHYLADYYYMSDENKISKFIKKLMKISYKYITQIEDVFVDANEIYFHIWLSDEDTILISVEHNEYDTTLTVHCYNIFPDGFNFLLKSNCNFESTKNILLNALSELDECDKAYLLLNNFDLQQLFNELVKNCTREGYLSSEE